MVSGCVRAVASARETALGSMADARLTRMGLLGQRLGRHGCRHGEGEGEGEREVVV